MYSTVCVVCVRVYVSLSLCECVCARACWLEYEMLFILNNSQ